MEDLYAELHLPHDASAKYIKKSYRKLAKSVHPDKNQHPEATAKFQRLNHAYEVLKDERLRAEFDLEWRLKHEAEQASVEDDGREDAEENTFCDSGGFTGVSVPKETSTGYQFGE